MYTQLTARGYTKNVQQQQQKRQQQQQQHDFESELKHQ